MMTQNKLREPSALVAVPAYGSSIWLRRCLERLDAHTPAQVEIIVWDDGTPSDSVAAAVRDVSSARVSYRRSEANLGFVATCNEIFRAAGRSDVALVNSDVLVTAGWFAGIQEAAYSGDRVATATAITNNGTVTSVPMPEHLHDRLASDEVIDATAAKIASLSDATYPDLPTGVGHCLYVRRSAIDLVGQFDETFSPGYGEEVDFSQRCLSVGLSHVLADCTYVYHAGGGTFDSEDQALVRSSRIRLDHEAIVRKRYPWYEALIADTTRRSDSPLSSSILSAAAAVDGITVTIDGRCFAGPVTGTQVQTAHLIRGLHQLERCHLRVLIPEPQSEFFRSVVSTLPGIDLLPTSSVSAATPKTAIVHRPYQVTNLAELRLLHDLGHRLVINQLDFIAFNSPNYFESDTAWLEYRLVTEVALAESARILFISNHAKDEAIRLGLIEDARASVVYCGTDHELGHDGCSTQLPEGIQQPFIVCLGTDFAHKNRAFAIRVLGAMRQVHGWDGYLILAGPHAGAGNARVTENEAAESIGDDSRYVIDLGSVTDQVRAGLLREAECVLCPTTYEGFGLIPFEAATSGTPCVYSLRTSHVELLPDAGNVIPEWDPIATGSLILEIVNNESLRQSVVRDIKLAGAPRTWTDTANRTLRAYGDALRAQPSAGGTVRRLRESLETQLAIRDRAVQNMHVALEKVHGDFAAIEKQVRESEPSIRFAQSIPGAFHGSLSFAARHTVLRMTMLWPIRIVFAVKNHIRPD